MSNYPREAIFEVWWSGPYRIEELEKEPADFLRTLSLYARYGDHPLYGRRVLTYIGKAANQSIITRLKQYTLDRETVYVASISKFESWAASDELVAKSGYDIADFVKERIGDDDIISRIEELLIYSLRPADNKRNKNSASRSWAFRIFNTGELGSMPPEVSGHYALYNAPEPQ